MFKKAQSRSMESKLTYSASKSSNSEYINAEKFMNSLCKGQLMVLDPFSALNEDINVIAEGDSD